MLGIRVRRLYASVRTRLHDAGLGHAIITTMLVLPDYKIMSSVLAFPGDRVVDADGLPDLPPHPQRQCLGARPVW